MTDMTAAPVQGTAPLSTSIDQGGAPLGQGGGVPNLTEPKQADAKPEPKAEKPEEAGETLRGELARIRDEEAKEAAKVKEKGDEAAKDAKAKVDEAEKAEKDEKAAKQRDETGKFAKAKAEGDEPEAKADKGEPEKAATGQGEADKSRQSEGQKYHEPPARFLPKAKEVWANVPHAVKGEIARLSQEHEAEVTKYREAGDRYEQFRKYDEIAKSNGRDFATDSIPKIMQFEQMVGTNPIAAIDFALREAGPRKADGSHLNLMDIVQHLAQNPQAYQQSVNQVQQRPQQRQPDPEVQALKQEIQSMRTEQVAQSIIAPFAAQNPRFHELQEDIAFFLNSGKIPASLSPQERLEAAYDMAVRINPTSSSVPSQAPKALADAKPAPSDDAGAKSIRGAPNGQDPDDDEGDETDIRSLLKREARKLAS
jgi:hypothetical protein